MRKDDKNDNMANEKSKRMPDKTRHTPLRISSRISQGRYMKLLLYHMLRTLITGMKEVRHKNVAHSRSKDQLLHRPFYHADFHGPIVHTPEK